MPRSPKLSHATTHPASATFQPADRPPSPVAYAIRRTWLLSKGRPCDILSRMTTQTEPLVAPDFAPTARTPINRHSERGRYSAAEIYPIVDEARIFSSA